MSRVENTNYLSTIACHQCVDEMEVLYNRHIKKYLDQLFFPVITRQDEENIVRTSTNAIKFLEELSAIRRFLNHYHMLNVYCPEVFSENFANKMKACNQSLMQLKGFLNNRASEFYPRTNAPEKLFHVDRRAKPETVYTTRDQQKLKEYHKMIADGQKDFDRLTAVFAKLHEHPDIKKILESDELKETFDEYCRIQKDTLNAIQDLTTKKDESVLITEDEIGSLGELISNCNHLINKMRSDVAKYKKDFESMRDASSVGEIDTGKSVESPPVFETQNLRSAGRYSSFFLLTLPLELREYNAVPTNN